MDERVNTQEVEKLKVLLNQLEGEFVFVKKLLDIIPDALFYKDVNGRFKYYNKALLDFMGLEDDDILEKTVFDIASRELAEVYDSMDKKLMEEKGHMTYEGHAKHASGVIKPVEFTKIVSLSPRDEVEGILGIMTDIEERKKEEAKKEKIDLMKEIFLSLNNRITSYEGLGDFFEGVLLSFQELFGHSRQSSILAIDDKGGVSIVASRGYNLDDIAKFKITVEDTFIYVENNGDLGSACIINDLTRYYHAKVHSDDPEIGDQYIQSSLEIPIMIEDSIKYIICIDSLVDNVFTDNDLYIANYIRTQFQILFRVFNLYQSTLHMSRYDAMTGLMNRRYSDITLREAMDRCDVSDECFHIVLYDLDRLKYVNDHYGHEIGDQYIVKFSNYLKDTFHGNDVVSRIGGDEFVSICYDTDMESLESKVASMREAFCKDSFETDKGAIYGDFSYGIEKYGDSNHSFKGLLRAADRKMYKHKERYNQ